MKGWVGGKKNFGVVGRFEEGGSRINLEIFWHYATFIIFPTVIIIFY